MVSKHSQEDESEEPDFGDSDSDVSAQQVRHAEDVLSVRLQTQIWLPRQAKPVKKDKEALRQEAWFFGSLKRSLDTLGFVPVKPPNLTSQKFHQHPCTLRLLLVWECS